VPPEFGKRNDFVLTSEMKEACIGVGRAWGISLDEFYAYFKASVEQCKIAVVKLFRAQNHNIGCPRIFKNCN
jgi:hypothetical protein